MINPFPPEPSNIIARISDLKRTYFQQENSTDRYNKKDDYFNTYYQIQSESSFDQYIQLPAKQGNFPIYFKNFLNSKIKPRINLEAHSVPMLVLTSPNDKLLSESDVKCLMTSYGLNEGENIFICESLSNRIPILPSSGLHEIDRYIIEWMNEFS
jgi:hypothetical protein